MQLHYSPGACSLAVHIALEEIGASFDLALVSTSDGSTHAADFLALNPKGRVPVLRVHGEDGGETITETITEAAAILTFLAHRYPDAGLLPAGALALARVYEWMSWIGSIHAGPIAQLWRTERFSAEPDVYPAIRAAGMEGLRSAYALIEARLGEGPWATGTGHSIVDPYLLVFYRWGHRLGVGMDAFPNWDRHAERMEARAAVQRALATEGIAIRS